MLAAIIEHPVLEAWKRVTVREHPLEVRQLHRPEANSKVQLAVVETRTKDGVDADRAGFRRLANPANAVRRQIHPASDKSLYLRFDLNILAQDGSQAPGVARLAREPSGKIKLCPILDRIVVLEAFYYH